MVELRGSDRAMFQELKELQVLLDEDYDIQLIKEIVAHNNWINSLNINPDATKIISTSIDASTKEWGILFGDLQKSTLGFKSLNNWASYSKDGSIKGTQTEH